ncbi:MAG: hypothetical protein ACXV8T_08575, partial [Acidimicrobiia bacterium]
MALADLLRPLAPDVAARFDGIAEPVPLVPDGVVGGEENDPPIPDLGPPSTRVVVLAGPAAMRNRAGLHALAEHLGAPVANSWGAKGIYPWDDPHHMGTCGLQRDDFPLLGFAGYDLVLAVGIDPAETPTERFALTDVALAEPNQLDAIRSRTPARPLRDAANDLYARIAAIAQPGYVDDSSPRHPARAVMDLKRSLGSEERVTAQPGDAGLWVARTFPTDRMGSVIVPAVDRPGIGAAVGLVSASQGCATVCVVEDPVDDTTTEIL